MYELIFLTAALGEKIDDQVLTKVRGFINEQGGIIKKEIVWEKSKLAYPVKKHLLGFYTVLEFEFQAEKVDELQKQLRLTADVLKFLIINKEGVKKETPRPKFLRPKTAVLPKITEEKGEKVKIEELDKKLEEILKE